MLGFFFDRQVLEAGLVVSGEIIFRRTVTGFTAYAIDFGEALAGILLVPVSGGMTFQAKGRLGRTLGTFAAECFEGVLGEILKDAPGPLIVKDQEGIRVLVVTGPGAVLASGLAFPAISVVASHGRASCRAEVLVMGCFGELNPTRLIVGLCQNGRSREEEIDCGDDPSRKEEANGQFTNHDQLP